MFESNEILDKLPNHLKALIIEQPYNDYTAEDHAVWRYVMRQNIHYLKDVAHGSYLEGLNKTGISIEQIPHMYGMNRILQEIGWAAVAVDGFIPPSAFMEFQAYNVLVIAADIRPIDQIGYTPAPDIIHEAAGHAPIIADQEYANYLRLFGKYGSKAFSSPKDKELYTAIRHLSILKADPYTSSNDIEKAEKKLDQMKLEMGGLSELAMIRNLHWWTVEYGLIGDLSNPKIFGAGLLSSINESKNALSNKVKKLAYNIDTKLIGFDITTMQPQLFVTPNFEHLTNVLEEFANSMALRTGGLTGLQKAIKSENIACYEYSSGIQVSGNVANVTSADDSVVYVQTAGPTSLSYKNSELENHGKEYHKEGFGSPVGKIKGINERFILLTDDELAKKGFTLDKSCEFEFESGVRVKGILKNIIRKDCKIILMSFEECVVTYKNHVLFFPEWGTYDMAVGIDIVSVFNGPADPKKYGYSFPAPKEKTHKIKHSNEALELHKIHQKIRDCRATNNFDFGLVDLINKKFKNEWLLNLELYELIYKNYSIAEKHKMSLLNNLKSISNTNKEKSKLITEGLALVKNSHSIPSE